MIDGVDRDLHHGLDLDTVFLQHMKFTPHNPSRMSRLGALAGGAFVAGALAAGVMTAGGCGTTQHDEYFAIREIVVEPVKGDGTMIASRDDARDSARLVADASRPARGSNSTVLATE